MKCVHATVMLISALLLLHTFSNRLVGGLPLPSKATTTPTAKQTAEIRYVSISDITETDDGLNNEDDDDDDSSEEWGEDDDEEYDDDSVEKDDQSGYSELPTYDDPKRGRRRNQNNKEWKINLNRTKASKNFFQLDIHLDLIQNLQLKVNENLGPANVPSHSRTRRAARVRHTHSTVAKSYLWKNNIVYYKIDNVFSKYTKTEIKSGIKHWKKALKGCLKFIRLDRKPGLEEKISKEQFGGGSVEHILFTKTDTGCWSQVGRTDTHISGRPYVQGQQLISIGEGCGERGTVIHEIGHAVGFWHEQSRRDRDEYVKIVRSNIIKSQKDQFRRMALEQVNSMGYAYDYWSIMHYGPFFFTKNNRQTIKVVKKYRPLNPVLGQREVLSYIDIAQVRAMYQCNKQIDESKQECVSKKTKGREYRGKLDYTQGGVMCQPWNKQYPHNHSHNLDNKKDGLDKNYCRNPGGEKERPWCYTTLAPKDNNLTWDYCDVKLCDK